MFDGVRKILGAKSYSPPPNAQMIAKAMEAKREQSSLGIQAESVMMRMGVYSKFLSSLSKEVDLYLESHSNRIKNTESLVHEDARAAAVKYLNEERDEFLEKSSLALKELRKIGGFDQ